MKKKNHETLFSLPSSKNNMKRLLILGIIAFFSCHPKSQKEVQKTDTVLIAAYGPNGPFFDSAIRVIGRARAFTDSTSLDGKMVEYTAFRVGQLTDTVRDSARKPKLDPAGHPIIHLVYPAQFVDTSFNKWIKVLEFPPHK